MHSPKNSFGGVGGLWGRPPTGGAWPPCPLAPGWVGLCFENSGSSGGGQVGVAQCYPTRRPSFCVCSQAMSGSKYSIIGPASNSRCPVMSCIASRHGRLAPSFRTDLYPHQLTPQHVTDWPHAGGDSRPKWGVAVLKGEWRQGKATPPVRVGIFGQTFSMSPLCRTCLLYTSPSPRDRTRSRMPSSA